MDVANPESSRAVLVGSASYAILEPLPSVTANLEDLRHALTDPDIWGVPPENVTVIADEPQQTVIYHALRAAAAATKPDGLLLIYYAGHGLVQSRELVLGLPRTDPQFPDEEGLVYAKIRQATQLSVAPRRVVILDCCYAGRAGRDVLAAGDAARQLANEAEIERACLLLAVGANQPAKAPLGDRNTAFTASLIRVLRNGSQSSDPVLTVRAIADEATRLLVAAGHGRPELRETNSGADIPLVRNVRVRQRNLTGAVLKAGPDVTDPELRQAVILVLRHNQSGAMGVRLNRPAEPLPPSLDDWRDLITAPAELFDGGPIARDGFIALVRLRSDVDNPLRFVEVQGKLGSVPLTNSPDSVRDSIADMRIFSGYVGWGAGGLEQLVGAGMLRVVDIPPARATFATGSHDRLLGLS
jgi:putative AlgH/UPF0301 family transcriptional regulator